MSWVDDALDNIEDVLLDWDLFKLDNDLTQAIIDQGTAIIAAERGKQ